MSQQLTNLVDRIINLSNECADLDRLKQAITTWSPDVMERNFWYGKCTVVGMIDICNANFREREDIRKVINEYTSLC